MRDITHGQRVDLTGSVFIVRIQGRNQAAFSQLAPFLLPLTANEQLMPGFGPIFPGEQRTGFEFVPGRGINIDLAHVPEAVSRLKLILYVIGGPSRGIGLDHVEHIDTVVESHYRFGLELKGRREAALILVEFYRRGDGWRLAATGQGFTTGIPGIMRSYGIKLEVPDATNDEPDIDEDYDSNAPPPGTGATGSGFAVAQRLVLTNHHVIEHARLITVTGENTSAIHTPASVIASDPINDIALLSLNHDALAVAGFRNDHDADLGEDVIVAGFPLQGLLGSGPQISAGNISALTGIHGNSALLQFNSPIGSGNSGGPMLDANGCIIGLVTSVLRQPQGQGSIAQNINFGVKASLLRSFLHASGVTPQINAGRSASRAEIARMARQFLYRITVKY